MSGVQKLDPASNRIARTALHYRQLACTYRTKLVIAQRSKKNMRKLTKRKFVDLVEELALSPAAKPGISEPFMKILKRKVDIMQDSDKHVILLFDEIFLRGRLFFNHSKGIVDGFESFGQRGRTNLVADHALVFMVQAIHNKWTQPVAFYFLSKTCPSTMLKLLIQDVVRALTSLDESLCKMSSLTLKHLNPQGRDKMRVSFAALVFSASVAKFMRALFKCSDGNKLTDSMDFADLCHNVDYYFDMCNGPRLNPKSEKAKPEQRINASPDSLHHIEWEKMYESLNKWTFIRKSDGTRHVPFCVRSWMENLKSYKIVCKKSFRDSSKPLLKVLKLAI
ncbi:DNA transposase [Frankliniella fusca]|uniref:DNA transposase n=1 Tax=Frankliniella fusca TaxID=407009 RepID=A0AAE1LKZ2_9NEOP|nr:DNA transposase [Frankliniella fusca]